MEFAAGFLEQATPALLTFTNYLAGVDAAGWGEKMMSMVLQVADTLMGAFKKLKPDPAPIEPLPSATEEQPPAPVS